MTNRLYIFTAAIVGLVTGFLTIHSLFAHSWTSMILWIVVGVVLLYFSANRHAAVYAGASFGFFTIAAWLISGFQGASDQLHGFLILTLGLSLLGAVCGMAGAFIYNWLFRKS